jgi:uncharacterized membrane protein
VRAAEIVASRVLFWGGMVSIAMMTLGLVGALWTGVSLAVTYSSVGQVARALAHWPVEPFAIVAAGILILLMTPVAVVTSLLIIFLRARDRRYAAISSLILLALLISLVFATPRT